MAMPVHVPLLMPELDLSPTHAVTVCSWLVSVGSEVSAGDRLLEILAGEALIDLPAPVAGRLTRKAAAEGEAVTAGQILGVIEVEECGS